MRAMILAQNSIIHPDKPISPLIYGVQVLGTVPFGWATLDDASASIYPSGEVGKIYG
jgi:hypothetical protein